MISVLMPCHNAQGTINEAIGSILHQTFEDFELVAVDDGSTDRTGELLRDWKGQDRRVRVVFIGASGIIRALETGRSVCRGKFIARMDADDWSHPDRLERQLELLCRDPDLAVAGCLVEGFPETDLRMGISLYLDWLNALIEPDDIAREIFIESPLPHPCALIRRTWLDRVGGYQDHGWAEDYDLWLRMHLSGARFAKVSQVLFRWRDHPARLSRVDSRYSVEHFLRAKSHYLCAGPLADRDALLIWGAGQMGRRLSKHLVRERAPLKAFVDVDPGKIGGTMRGVPILSRDSLPAWWAEHENPVVLSAVGSRGARSLIREYLVGLGLQEGQDWWAVA